MEDKFRKILSDRIGIDLENVTAEATMEDIGADSLDIVEIAMELEEAYALDMPEDPKFRNVGELWQYVQDNRGDGYSKKKE